MKKLVICKVCGFVMDEKDLKDVCPACGVPKTAFVEYKSRINEKRSTKLGLHLHPITVHFPEAIAVFLVGFMALAFITTGSFHSNLMTTSMILSVFFPITVIIASVTGIYEGKLRFKKLSPPWLKIKIYLGVTLFLDSLIIFYLFQIDYTNLTVKLLIFIFSLISLVLSAILGKMGGKLTECIMPG